MLVGVGRICISLAVPLATDTPDEPGIDAEPVMQALEYLAAGASAVQVGSAAFREPLLARRVRSELATLLARRGLPGIGALKTTTLD